MDLLMQDRKIALDHMGIEGVRAGDEIGRERGLQPGCGGGQTARLGGSIRGRRARGAAFIQKI